MVTTETSESTAIGYTRRSHESTERTVSLSAQRSAIERYAAEQGWRLAAVLEHDGISGGKRSRFAALDAAVKIHGARAVVCFSLDRLGRDVVGVLGWMSSAARRGVALHVVGRGVVEVASSSGFLGTTVEAMMSEHYKAHRQLNTSSHHAAPYSGHPEPPERPQRRRAAGPGAETARL